MPETLSRIVDARETFVVEYLKARRRIQLLKAHKRRGLVGFLGLAEDRGG